MLIVTVPRSVVRLLTNPLDIDRFAAAMIDNKIDCWVLNVVPVNEPNTLPVIYDRGLIGVIHDWYIFLSLHFCVHAYL